MDPSKTLNRLGKPVSKSVQNNNTQKQKTREVLQKNPTRQVPRLLKSKCKPKPPKVYRTTQVGSVSIRVVESDITEMPVDVIINAANSLSFTPMDGGVSGALRRACKPAIVTGLSKMWWDQKGTEHHDVKLPTTQAGVHPAAGNLKERGVQYVVHAVGPIWTDWPIAEKTFGIVLPRIRRTVMRALSVTARVGGHSCALPAISGGIFTHWRLRSDIKEREQRAARKAVVKAVFDWASNTDKTGSLVAVDLVDLPQGSKGKVDDFVDAFDSVFQEKNRNDGEEERMSSIDEVEKKLDKLVIWEDPKAHQKM